MHTRTSLMSLVVLAGALAVAALDPAAAQSRATAAPGEPTASAVPVTVVARPGAALSTTHVRRYRMSGRIRPFFIWMGRDDIGLGEIIWRTDGSGRRAYELLIGTEPDRAPRGLNRWGFVAEQLDANHGDMLGLMFGTAVASFAEANHDAEQTAGVRVRGLSGHLEGGLAEGRAVQAVLDDPPTVHDVERVIAQLAFVSAVSPPQPTRVTPAARPGLLSATADAIDWAIAAARRGAARIDRTSAPRVPYVFGRLCYELAVERAQLTTWTSDGGASVRAVETSFVIRTLATGARTEFDVTTAIDGSLAGVPLSIHWQPRWWLEIGLHLRE